MKIAAGAVVALLAAVAAVVTAWWWLGTPVAMLDPPVATGGKLPCVSYAPFRADQTPLLDSTRVDARQIDEDLAKLATITNCVRTYSIEHGVDQVPALAGKYGLKVMQGIWLSRLPDKNRWQVDTAIALAKRYPDVISAIIVGNEVLLRGELSPLDLGSFIREVKAAVPVPVTYADVWEFWLRNRDLVNAVDFVTVHILPYWEDFPIAADKAAAHTDSIRRQVAASFPGKDILIGEFGWPSAGRMREGALPSPSNQARVVQEVLDVARREHYRVNVIEAFDQPWKRRLEGTVGGHWGLIPADRSAPKFVLGQPVSDHPLWRWQAAGGALMVVVVVAAALWRRRPTTPATLWPAVALAGAAAGVAVPWTIELVPLESLGVGGWLRWVVLAVLAVATPIFAAMALGQGNRLPALLDVLGRGKERTADRLVLALGICLAGATLLGVHSALGLVFDARYRDFPFAPMTAAIVPLAAVAMVNGRQAAQVLAAERIAAAVLVFAALYIVPNESTANWQAGWLCGLFGMLGVTLFRRDARSRE
jgi:exo-beta-1,3-glucanase (GH17 family)